MLEARQDYQTKLAHHNSEIRSFCHQSGIHYSLYMTDLDTGRLRLCNVAGHRSFQIAYGVSQPSGFIWAPGVAATADTLPDQTEAASNCIFEPAPLHSARQARRRPAFGRLRLPPIFFLQLLLLTLLILALGEPVFSVRATKVAIVLDNSASMQTLEDQQTRFTLAQEKARGCSPISAPPAR